MMPRFCVFSLPSIKLRISICMLTLLASCTTGEKQTYPDQQPGHLRIPDAVEKAILSEFPGALPYHVAIDSLVQQLSRVGIKPHNILWGQAICVDDITNTKDKLIHREIKGPFTLGGLAGYPFAGITGIEAFAHHVPEYGTALLFVGPHIGYSESEGWGKILRHEQRYPSSCCGALSAALAKLQKNEIKEGAPSEDDYQEDFIEQLALKHQQDIVNDNVPLVALTQVVSREAIRKMTEYAKEVHERNFLFAVVVVGVIINTDYQYDDYLWINYVSIKDIRKNIWIKNP